MNSPVIPVLRLRPESDSDIPLPRRMTCGAAGMDAAAAVAEDVIIKPGEIVMIPTGFAMAVPPGFEIQVRPRSGLAAKHGVTVVNAPGTIDSDYRGEVMIALINLSRAPHVIRRGDRVAQLVVGRVIAAEFSETDSLEATDRMEGGFGHTGVR